MTRTSFAQAAAPSGQFAQRRELRVMAQEAALKEITNSKLQRFLANTTASNRADVKVGDSVLFYKAANHKTRVGAAARLGTWASTTPARRRSSILKRSKRLGIACGKKRKRRTWEERIGIRLAVTIVSMRSGIRLLIVSMRSGGLSIVGIGAEEGGRKCAGSTDGWRW